MIPVSPKKMTVHDHPEAIRRCVIANGRVENIIHADPSFTIEGKLIVDREEGVEIGDLYENGIFSKP